MRQMTPCRRPPTEKDDDGTDGCEPANYSPQNCGDNLTHQLLEPSCIGSLPHLTLETYWERVEASITDSDVWVDKKSLVDQSKVLMIASVAVQIPAVISTT